MHESQTRLCRSANWFAAVGLCILAWSAFSLQRHEQPCCTARAESLETIGPTERRQISITICNPGDRAVEVVGANAVCSTEGCAHIDELPTTVEARAERRIPVVFTPPKKPGPFEYKFPLYVNGDQLTTIDVTISGMVK